MCWQQKEASFRYKTIRPHVNGRLVWQDNTDNMGRDTHCPVADIARNMAPEPGDVLLSGTPANSRPVQPGDCKFPGTRAAGGQGAQFYKSTLED